MKVQNIIKKLTLKRAIIVIAHFDATANHVLMCKGPMMG